MWSTQNIHAVCGSAKWSNHVEIWKFHFRNHWKCLIKLKTNSLLKLSLSNSRYLSWEMKIYAHKKDYVQGYVDEKMSLLYQQTEGAAGVSRYGGRHTAMVSPDGLRMETGRLPRGQQGASHCSSLKVGPGSWLLPYCFRAVCRAIWEAASQAWVLEKVLRIKQNFSTFRLCFLFSWQIFTARIWRDHVPINKNV